MLFIFDLLSDMIGLNLTISLSTSKEFRRIFLSEQPYTVSQDQNLEMEAKNSTFSITNSHMTKYRIYYHRANLSKLKDLHSKAFRFVSWPSDLFNG